MQIKTWTNFSKRENSTKQPTGGTLVEAVLKDDVSGNAPIFSLKGDQSHVNYIEAMGKKYFVADFTHPAKGYTNLICREDNLATWKAHIGATKAFVQYASSSTNTDISDPRNVPTYIFDETKTNVHTLANFSTIGSYLIGVINTTSHKTLGTVTYYLMDALSMKAFTEAVFDNSFVNNIQNQFYGLKELLVDCIWVPFNASLISTGDLQTVWIGAERLPNSVQGYPVQNRISSSGEITCSVNFPAVVSDFSYLAMPPYTTASLYLPFVGNIPLDLDVIAPDQTFKLSYTVDVITGDILYKISKMTGDVVSTYQGNCATKIPLSSMSYNAVGTITAGISAIGGLASTVGGIVSGNAAMATAGIGGMVGGAVGAMQSMSIHSQQNGSISSAIAASMGLDVIATVFTRRPTEDDIDEGFKDILGMPLYKNVLINTLSGYVQCAGASVEMPGTSAEKEAVNAYLNSGFYYE